MAIEWYPGHMVKARKEAAAAMGKTDVVIEVLDARVPLSSCNPVVESIRRELKRPALKLLNKIDIADAQRTQDWLAYYNAQESTRALGVCAKKTTELARITKECLALVPDRGTLAKPLRMIILGIPNVGKSTLMNGLLKRHVANVGDEPAITKMQMRHRLGDTMWLVDTPGMLWPGVPQFMALKLAAAHSIGRNAYDDDTVAIGLAELLLREYLPLLQKRFGEFETPHDGHQLLQVLAQKRSFVVKGGGLDVSRAATMLLNEFRTGALGRITLDTLPLPTGA